MHETLLLVHEHYHYLGMLNNLNFPQILVATGKPRLINRVHMREIFQGIW